MRHASGDRRLRPGLEAAGAGVVAAAVFLATLSDNHSETEDSLTYAGRIRDDPHSDAPHLVYDWVGWAWYQAVRALGLADGSLRPLQVMNALLGAAAVALLWLVVRRAGQRRAVAFTAAGVVAFSYGFWWNSVEAEVYALSALLVVACLGLTREAVERPTWRRFALVGVVNGLAVLAHLQTVYFAGVVGVALVLARRRGALPDWRRCGAAYVAGAAAVVLPAFVAAAAVLRLGSFRAFHAWFTVTTGDGQYGNLEPEMVPKGVVAAGRALVGGHFALSFEGVRSALAERFPNRPLVEEAFFLRGYSGVLAAALVALALAVAAGIALLAASWLRRPRLAPEARLLAALSAAWLVSYLPMLLYWDPLNTELWYVAWIPAAVLVALPLGAPRSLVPGRLAAPFAGALVGGLLLVNLLGSVWPQSDPDRDYWRVRTDWYAQHATGADLVLAFGYIQSAYLNYRTEAEVVDVEALFAGASGSAQALEEVDRLLAGQRTGAVYVSDQVLHPFAATPAGCETVALGCDASAALRPRLLPRADVVSAGELERVYVLRRGR